MALIRLLFFAFIALTIVYVSVSLYSRSMRKEKLGRQWDEDIRDGDRAAYIAAGLKEYDTSLRRRLILGVYIVPVAVVGLIIYLVNYN